MESGLTTHQLSEELDQQRGSRQLLCKAHSPYSKLIWVSSGGGDGINRSDMQDRRTELSEVRPPSALLVTLCLSSASHHRRFQRASQCAKWLVSSIKNEFAK